MVKLGIHRKRSGVPVLSQEEINQIGEKVVADFCPSAMREPQALDVDSFAQNYLGMVQDYQFLSHCGAYLGMTVFNNTNKIPVYNPALQRAEYISASANTIIIDNTLLASKQEHRYRFTMGHEVGHGLVHGPYFQNKRNHPSSHGGSSVALIQCRTDLGRNQQKDPEDWNEKDWMEWQANALSSAILMPKSMVLKLVESIKTKGHPKETEIIRGLRYTQEVSNTFNVSTQAAQYRLQGLGVLPKGLAFLPGALDFLDIF